MVASSTEAATPSVPLASTFQAPHSPDSDRDSPHTVIRCPSATNGSSTAKATNGTSISIRVSTCRAGTRATTATTASSSAYAPKAHTASRGVATTSRTKQKTAASLQCAGSACTGECPCRYSVCECPAPIVAVRLSLGGGPEAPEGAEEPTDGRAGS